MSSARPSGTEMANPFIENRVREVANAWKSNPKMGGQSIPALGLPLQPPITNKLSSSQPKTGEAATSKAASQDLCLAESLDESGVRCSGASDEICRCDMKRVFIIKGPRIKSGLNKGFAQLLWT